MYHDLLKRWFIPQLPSSSAIHDSAHWSPRTFGPGGGRFILVPRADDKLTVWTQLNLIHICLTTGTLI